MDPLAQPPADADLHLLTEWDDPFRKKRVGRAALYSGLVHAFLLLGLVFVPENVWFSPPQAAQTAEVRRVITPLIEPLTELTQKAPNHGKLNKEFNATELKPRPNIQIPAGPPSTTRPKAAVPAPPAAEPKPQPPTPLPEPPKVQAVVKEM